MVGAFISSIVIVFPIFCYSQIMRNFYRLRDHDFHQKQGALIESTRISKKSTTNQMWIPIFLFRRLVYSSILIFFQFSPVFQILACIGTTTIVILLL